MFLTFKNPAPLLWQDAVASTWILEVPVVIILLNPPSEGTQQKNNDLVYGPSFWEAEVYPKRTAYSNSNYYSPDNTKSA
jgi:hypothetical protein